MVYYICFKETIYNGRSYRPGDPWLPEDGGDPPEMEGGLGSSPGYRAGPGIPKRRRGGLSIQGLNTMSPAAQKATEELN